MAEKDFDVQAFARDINELLVLSTLPVQPDLVPVFGAVSECGQNQQLVDIPGESLNVEILLSHGANSTVEIGIPIGGQYIDTRNIRTQGQVARFFLRPPAG